MTVALPPPEDRAFADVWSALGGELKPSLDLVVSVPVDSGREVPVRAAGPRGRHGRRGRATATADRVTATGSGTAGPRGPEAEPVDGSAARLLLRRLQRPGTGGTRGGGAAPGGRPAARTTRSAGSTSPTRRSTPPSRRPANRSPPGPPHDRRGTGEPDRLARRGAGPTGGRPAGRGSAEPGDRLAVLAAAAGLTPLDVALLLVALAPGRGQPVRAVLRLPQRRRHPAPRLGRPGPAAVRVAARPPRRPGSGWPPARR